MIRLLSLILLGECVFGATSTFGQTVERANWSILLYYVGEEEPGKTSMDDSIVRSLSSLASVGAGNGVNVLAQVDRGRGLSDLIRRFYPDPRSSAAMRLALQGTQWTIKEKLGEVNSGSPAALEQALAWMAQNYPAEHYGLVIKSHGSGVLSWWGPGSVRSEHPGQVETFFVGYDDEAHDCLTPFEVEAVLARFKDQHHQGRKLDLLVADSCDPAMIEVLYQLHDEVEYFIGSESTIIIGSFRYAGMLSLLKAGPQIDARQLCERIVKDFIDSPEHSSTHDVMAAFALEAIPALVERFDLFAERLLAVRRDHGKFGVKGLVSFYDGAYWDLGKLAEAISQGRGEFATSPGYAELKAAAEEVLTALRATRVSMWYDGDYATGKVGGLSLFWPSKADKYQEYRNYYKTLALSEVTAWDEFLDCWFGVLPE